MSTTLYHNIMNPFLSRSSKIFVFLRRCVWLREIMRIQQKKYEKKKLFGKAIYSGAEKPSVQFLCTHYFGVLRPNRLCSSQYIIILIWDKKEFLLGIYIIGKHHTKWRQSHKHSSAGLDKHYYRYAFHFMSKS